MPEGRSCTRSPPTHSYVEAWHDPDLLAKVIGLNIFPAGKRQKEALDYQAVPISNPNSIKFFVFCLCRLHLRMQRQDDQGHYRSFNSLKSPTRVHFAPQLIPSSFPVHPDHHLKLCTKLLQLVKRLRCYLEGFNSPYFGNLCHRKHQQGLDIIDRFHELLALIHAARDHIFDGVGSQTLSNQLLTSPFH